MLSKLQTLKEEREQGFTLIELLVVILIIGILSAIAIPAFMNQRKSAVDSSVQSDVSNAAKAVETAAVKVGAGNIVFGATAVGIVVDDATGVATITPASGAVAFTTQVSDGTTMTIQGDTRDGYIIVGKNDGGDTAKVTGFTYDSKTGGM